MAGITTYVTGQGPTVIGVYDVFGLHKHTLHGADVLAEHGFRVLVPDVLEGHGLNADEMESMSEQEKMAKFKAFQAEAPSIPECVEKLQHVVHEVGTDVFLYGACWGAKPAVLLAIRECEKIKGIAWCHPS